MKYVALMSVRRLGKDGQTTSFFRSSFTEDKKDAEEWIEKAKTRFPNHCINTYVANRDYLLHTAILALDEEKSSNAERFIKYFYFVI